ncbi:DNA-processing protein DprA [Paenibacillus urinalis]|uniref:DNA-processing protein DprA n=1 Tax=Paenibacillus urinalis TaxID=521520 RepID=UPI0019603AD1
MESRYLLLGLHEIDGIGRKTINKLLSSGNLHKDMLKYETQDWIQTGMTKDQALKITERFSEVWIEERIHALSKGRTQFVTYLDEDYPVFMKETPDPPLVLYLKGNVSLLHHPSIAMVGTRVPSGYGKKVGEILASELSNAGYTIVSGLARGIDSICHEAALKAGGTTIAVLGGGFSHIYPTENHTLANQIENQGLLVSEYPLHMQPRPGLFPQRNRIIAGLTYGTLVVEADIRSGSLITADAALEAGRDVFAVPGMITSPKSQGTLNLIKQGAKLVTCAEDINEEYAHLIKPRTEERIAATGSESAMKMMPSLSSEEQMIYDLLEAGPLTLDELVGKLPFDFGHLHSVLLSLIIKKQIMQLPGAIYKLI